MSELSMWMFRKVPWGPLEWQDAVVGRAGPRDMLLCWELAEPESPVLPLVNCRHVDAGQ